MGVKRKVLYRLGQWLDADPCERLMLNSQVRGDPGYCQVRWKDGLGEKEGCREDGSLVAWSERIPI